VSKLPKITVVTPSFNQGEFLEETIQSVLGQGYTNLEYIIIDGGSTDESIEIIKRYDKHLAYWVSEPDSGQANALNRGFALATGEIYCWLCSDDLFEPGALARVADAYMAGHEWMIGQCFHFGGGFEPCVKPAVLPDRPAAWLADNVPQPSVFWSAGIHRRAGPLREDLHYIFDWEYWLRFVFDLKIKPHFVPAVMSHYRFHPSSKSVTVPGRFKAEASNVRKQRLQEISRTERRTVLQRLREKDVEILVGAAWKARAAGQKTDAALYALRAAALIPNPATRRALVYTLLPSRFARLLLK
jgi:glycosyltransferase involved in cell wall biosynthesis